MPLSHAARREPRPPGAAPAGDLIHYRPRQMQNRLTSWLPSRSGDAGWDTDQDGMPDTWESSNGLNPNDAADRNGDTDGDGYTNLEEYLNSLVP